jgi:aminomethyltransferase
MLVVNASNIDKDFAWIAGQVKGFADAVAVNTSARYALIAVQGPAAVAIVQSLTSVDLSAIKYYWFASGEAAGVRATLSRTGYTGEDGFELFVPPAQAERVWNTVLEAGKSAGLVPCGLGARDTLRLEAGLHLYGQDMDTNTTAVEASLGWAIARSRRAGGKKEGGFPGAAVYLKESKNGTNRQLVGLVGEEPVPVRHGTALVDSENKEVGLVTSGTVSPSTQRAIMLAYVNSKTESLFAVVRGTPRPVRITKLPFVPKRYKKS